MVKGATVTLPLGEFDGLRADSEGLQKILPKIAACFEYEFKENGEPEKCKTCTKENPDCKKCKVFKESPPWEETLTVDTERLINLTKQFALYGKDVEADIEGVTVVEKKKRGGRK